MKSKIVIDVRNDKEKPEMMNIKVTRKDLMKPSADETIMLNYIQHQIAMCVNGGFAPANDVKGDKDGKTSKKQ